MSAYPDQASLNGKEQHKDTFSVEDFGGHVAALVDDSKQPRTSTPSQPHGAGTTDYRALLQAARVRPTDEIDEDTACLTIEHDGKSFVIGTMGNLSTIAGRAKAKKTFAVSFAIAAAVASLLVLDRIKGTLPNDQQTVLLFDTEQSRNHVLKVIKRICRLCGVEDPSNLIVYSLRPYAPQDRLKIVDFALHNTPGLGLVVIDGVRDLAVDPVLDSEQASHIMTHLLQWTDRLNIHIMCVLHQNKNDSNLRGHLGTELVNKSETVISISRDPTDKEVSIVAPEYCRDKEFEEFRFSLDDTGFPFLVGGETDGLGGSANTQSGRIRPAKPNANTITSETIKAIIMRAFAREEHLQYAQLRTNITEASLFVGATLTKNGAELLIQRIIQNGHLVKFRPDKSRWDAYCISSDYLMD